jgi:hypothetical protein
MIREFESYLSNKKHIKGKYVPYYMKWVSDCYSYLDESVESRLPADRIQTFLSHLSKVPIRDNILIFLKLCQYYPEAITSIDRGIW